MALKGVVTFLLLLCITSRVLSLSCPGPCVRANCDLSRAQGCTAGILEGGDPCGCCDVCAKDIGEVCGGPWDITGICANWLTCLKDTSIPNFDFNAEGTCVRGDGTAEFEQRFIVLGQNKGVTWQRARTLCQDAGYDLADLANPHIDATRLASYLLTKHNLRYYWLGGKGQGSNIAYLSGQVLEPQSPLWRKPDHGFQTSTNFCMYIRDDGNPNPLGTFNCQDNTYMAPLCEVSGQTPPAAPDFPINFPGK